MRTFHFFLSDEKSRTRYMILLISGVVVLTFFYMSLVHSVIAYSVHLSQNQKQYADTLVELGNLRATYMSIFASEDFENNVLNKFVLGLYNILVVSSILYFTPPPLRGSGIPQLFERYQGIGSILPHLKSDRLSSA